MFLFIIPLDLQLLNKLFLLFHLFLFFLYNIFKIQRNLNNLCHRKVFSFYIGCEHDTNNAYQI